MRHAGWWQLVGSSPTEAPFHRVLLKVTVRDWPRLEDSDAPSGGLGATVEVCRGLAACGGRVAWTDIAPLSATCQAWQRGSSKHAFFVNANQVHSTTVSFVGHLRASLHIVASFSVKQARHSTFSYRTAANLYLRALMC